MTDEEAEILEEYGSQYTENVVCPYCGYEDEDSWELKDNDGECECGRCGKDFLYTRDIEITYSTSKNDGGAE